jgi:HlyD family secretion protein
MHRLRLDSFFPSRLIIRAASQGSRCRVTTCFLALPALAGLFLPGIAWSQGPAPVRVTAVHEREVSTGQAFVGTVTPARKSVIGSAVSGRIVELRHNEGDYVEEGEVLAQVLTGTIAIELAHAESELKFRQEELEESVKSFPVEKQQADARLAAAKASRDNADSNYNRQQVLATKKSTSQEAVDNARAKAEEADAMFLEAQATRRLVFEGAREQRIRQLEAKVASQQEQVNLIKDRMKKYTIRAYFTGYVTAEFTEVGHWIRDGESVVEMAELDTVDIRVNVNEDAITDLEVGEEVRVEVNATRTKSFPGTIQAIVPQADVKSRAFPVLIRVKNPRRTARVEGAAVTHELKSGMLARAILPVGRQKASLLVSKDSVVLGGRVPLVYAVVPSAETAGEGTVRPVPVELGIADGGDIQVTPVSPEAGLKSDDLVVIEGNERLRPGQKVRYSLAPREAAAR